MVWNIVILKENHKAGKKVAVVDALRGLFRLLS